MLTAKQNQLLRFIHLRLLDTGTPPSFDEMKEALDLRSKSGIHRLILGLEERGFIRRLHNRARAIEVLRMPEDAVPTSGKVASRFSPNVIEGSLGRLRPRGGPGTPSNDAGVAIPMMGRIAAGVPIAAIQTRGATITVPPDMVAGGEHFALEVRGDSMVEAGILDSDTVIIRKQDSADTGDIVVALVDDDEATLKRFRRRGASIALEAANPAYKTQIYGPDRVKIQGRLVSLLRRY